MQQADMPRKEGQKYMVVRLVRLGFVFARSTRFCPRNDKWGRIGITDGNWEALNQGQQNAAPDHHDHTVVGDEQHVGIVPEFGHVGDQ